MKQQYLFCRLGENGSLQVNSFADDVALKQIELNLILAKKYVKDIAELTKKLGRFNLEPKIQWQEANRSFQKLTQIVEESEYMHSINHYIEQYTGSIVLPYTKILG